MILEERLEQGFSQWNISYTDRMLQQFRTYYSLLEARNKVMNLTAIEGEKDTAELHFLDSSILLRDRELGDRSIADIGTGAGFPGIVLKILVPDSEIVLVDSLDKRVRFLQEVCEALSLKYINCLHARAEELPGEYRGHFDLVTSRAVARMQILSELCMPFVRQGGHFIAMKGPDCGEEVKEASEAVRKLGGRPAEIDTYTIPDTEVEHSLVSVYKDGITSDKYPRRWAQIKKSPL